MGRDSTDSEEVHVVSQIRVYYIYIYRFKQRRKMIRRKLINMHLKKKEKV